ncbi:hypothetical protein QJQ45_018419 [Haematococcus lacustris]|nr:hypothetical protein QJQ45_018419 [Haematococcus lacustris]
MTFNCYADNHTAGALQRSCECRLSDILYMVQLHGEPQVGQCGNQLGQELWRMLSSQRPACGTTDSMGLLEDLEYFKLTSQGQRQARCLLIDTEPKVIASSHLLWQQVQQVLASSSTGSNLFSRERCYLGQSGRGNNWAFGYTQWQPRSQPRGPGGAGGGWDGSSQVATPSHREFLILDAVTEGIRQEAEAADGAPNFLLLHSLGGGSGSGLGSRLLEHLREEYPLNYIATLSVAPRSAGDSALQSLNAVMALSFLQAYADVVLLFDNGSMLEEAGRQHKSVGLQEVNRGMAAAALGALWPLDASEARAAGGRIRDMACTVAADPCLKLLETRTVAVHANLGAQAAQQRQRQHSSGRGSTAAAEAAQQRQRQHSSGRGSTAAAEAAQQRQRQHSSGRGSTAAAEAAQQRQRQHSSGSGSTAAAEAAQQRQRQHSSGRGSTAAAAAAQQRQRQHSSGRGSTAAAAAAQQRQRQHSSGRGSTAAAAAAQQRHRQHSSGRGSTAAAEAAQQRQRQHSSGIGSTAAAEAAQQRQRQHSSGIGSTAAAEAAQQRQRQHSSGRGSTAAAEAAQQRQRQHSSGSGSTAAAEAAQQRQRQHSSGRGSTAPRPAARQTPPQCADWAGWPAWRCVGCRASGGMQSKLRRACCRATTPGSRTPLWSLSVGAMLVGRALPAAHPYPVASQLLPGCHSTQTKAAATSRPPGFQGPADLRMPAKNGHGAGPGAINVLEQRVQQPGPAQHPAVPHFVAATGGPASFGTPDEIGGAVWVRQGAARLVCGELPGVTGTAKPAHGKGLGPASATIALSVVACRSSALGLLSSTLNRAKALCDAGAYLHWYERHGCSKEAVQEALYSVQDVADSYRLATGIREQFGPG